MRLQGGTPSAQRRARKGKKRGEARCWPRTTELPLLVVWGAGEAGGIFDPVYKPGGGEQREKKMGSGM